MRAGRAILMGVVSVGGLGGPALGQANLGENTAGGLHWHIAAPQDAGWSLSCAFRPVTRAVNAYERRRWTNRLRLRGQGPMPGRLPYDNGRCILTKTDGAGAVGLAIVKAGVAHAGGTADRSRPVSLNVY